jgi:DNA-binding GntR family transcriptional regulator
MLSLSKENRMSELVADHKEIAESIKARDSARAVEAGVQHLSQLDETITRILASNANYFDATRR